MKRTSPLRPQLEEQKSGGRKGSSVGRKRAPRRGSSPHRFGCLGQMPFSLLANWRLPLRPYLSQENVNALVPTTPHICIWVMSSVFHAGCLKQTAVRLDVHMRVFFFGKAAGGEEEEVGGGRKIKNNDPTCPAQEETAEQSD